MRDARKALDSWTRYLRSLMDSNLIFVAEDSSLAKWRKTLLLRLLPILMVFGWLVGVPSMMLAVSEALWTLAIVAVAVPAIFSGFYFLRSRDNGWLSIGLLLVVYLLGVVTLLSHGLIALIFFVALPVVAVLLVSERLAVWAAGINTITLFGLGYFFRTEAGVVGFSDSPLAHWLVIALNFSVSSAVLVWACSFLLQGVDAVLLRQRESVRELKDNAMKLQQMAMHDTLTGLPNRRLLQDRIAQVMTRATRQATEAALVLMDLDDFKNVNDSHGHQLGDELIVAVAQRLHHCVRAVDTVARLGGDEFVVLVTDVVSESELQTAVKRILNTVNGEYTLSSRTLYVSASAGVAVFPRDGKDEQALLKCADTAMYRAKELGRNRYQFFHIGMNMRLLERVALEEALRTAIERQQLSLHYQPRISAHNGSCQCAEALIRWHHPVLGWVSPARFIPVAEDTGLIVPIGAWVLNTAAAQLLAWQSRHPQLRLSINVSAREFRDEGLGDRIRDATPGLEGDSLELEITESLVMDDLQEAQLLLDRVREHGVCVAIDDFGTGLSCLAYLKALPLDVIKIDKSFVRDVETDRQNHAIVKTIVDLANNLQLTTVAEGVETQAQADVLRSLGVNELQGYHFAHPMPADAFEAWLNKQAVVRSGV